jgi:hypothetical protein
METLLPLHGAPVKEGGGAFPVIRALTCPRERGNACYSTACVLRFIRHIVHIGFNRQPRILIATCEARSMVDTVITPHEVSPHEHTAHARRSAAKNRMGQLDRSRSRAER